MQLLVTILRNGAVHRARKATDEDFRPMAHVVFIQGVGVFLPCAARSGRLGDGHDFMPSCNLLRQTDP